MRFLICFSLIAASLTAAPKRAVAPGGAAPSKIESPGVLAGGYLYVSAQGPTRPDGATPQDAAAQTRLALGNIQAIVEAAGLSLDHVVYTQVYLTDLAQLPALDDVFARTFPQPPPARSVIVAAGLDPGPIAIRAVAVVDRSAMQPVHVEGYELRGYSAGMLTSDRLYLSSLPAKPGPAATQVERALDAFEAIAQAAGLDLRHVVFVNPFLTEAISYGELNAAYAQRFEHGNTPARATIFVSDLPTGDITFTGVAVRNLASRQAIRPKNMAPSPTASPCVLGGNTLFCSAKSGFIPGPNSGIYASTVEHQLRQTMRNLLDGLEEAGMGFGDIVSTSVYLDDISEQPAVDAIYREYTGDTPPARAVVQQLAPKPASRRPDPRGRYGTLEQISLIAVRDSAP